MSNTDSPTMGMLGEKEFIKQLIPSLRRDIRLIDGHGHDATALQLDVPTRRLAFKIDRAAHPLAVTQGWSGYHTWGRMAVTANCSDLLAAGSSPFAFMVAIVVPGSWSAQDVKDIVFGCQEECERNRVAFAGGDTKEGSVPQVIGSAIGVYFDDHAPLPRTKARAGDKLVIAGPVGGFLGAALLLTYLKDAPKHEVNQWIDYLAFPRARWNEAAYVGDYCTPHAAMDTSDGIFDAIMEIARGSIGVCVDLDRVPFHPFALRCAEELGFPLENFLFGGGDWNILYALDPGSECPELEPAAGVLTAVGTFTAEPQLMARQGANYYDMAGPRHEHFRSRLEDGLSFLDTLANGPWFSRHDPTTM